MKHPITNESINSPADLRAIANRPYGVSADEFLAERFAYNKWRVSGMYDPVLVRFIVQAA